MKDITTDNELMNLLDDLISYKITGDLERKKSIIKIIEFAAMDETNNEMLGNVHNWPLIIDIMGNNLEHFDKILNEVEQSFGTAINILNKINPTSTVLNNKLLDPTSQNAIIEVKNMLLDPTSQDDTIAINQTLNNNKKDVESCQKKDVESLYNVNILKEEEERRIDNNPTPICSQTGDRLSVFKKTTNRKACKALIGVERSDPTSFNSIHIRHDTSRFNIDEIKIQVWNNGNKKGVAEYSAVIDFIIINKYKDKTSSRRQYFDFTDRTAFRRIMNRKASSSTSNNTKAFKDYNWYVEINQYVCNQDRVKKKIGADKTLIAYSQKIQINPKNKRTIQIHRRKEEVAILHKNPSLLGGVGTIELFYGDYKIIFKDFIINKSKDPKSADLMQSWYKVDNRR